MTVHNEFNVLHSYTLECSYAGTMRGKHRGHHFSIQHLKKLGADLVCAVYTLTADKDAVEKCIKELR